MSAHPNLTHNQHFTGWLKSRLAQVAACVVLVALIPNHLEAVPAQAQQRPGDANTIVRPLKLAKNKRFLVRPDGTPFFYLSDTNWELVRRTTRDDARLLIEKRKKQGFTVLCTVATGILDVLRDNNPLSLPNAYGDYAFHDHDFARPATTQGADPHNANQYDYWDHLDFIIETANKHGLTVALLPAWHGHYTSGKLTTANARAYGNFLGKRLGHHDNIIWVLGGDTNITSKTPNQDDIIRAAKSALKSALGWQSKNQTVDIELFRDLAGGIKSGETKPHLMTYHPRTGTSSSNWLHDEPWLDFNMIQSGHNARDTANDTLVARDYAMQPAKPTLDGESRYEDHAIGYDSKQGWFDDYDTRQAAYWGLFAGALGHTYGSRGVWQMHEPHHTPYGELRYPWREAIDLPGANQMRHVRNLVTSRPMLSRVPNNHIVTNDQAPPALHARATSGDGYAFIYASAGHTFTANINEIASGNVIAWWYDPRTGKADHIGSINGRETTRKKFTPPGSPRRGNDWILVLDDAQKNYPPPGTHPNAIP